MAGSIPERAQGFGISLSNLTSTLSGVCKSHHVGFQVGEEGASLKKRNERPGCGY
jgi:hypothetical protein